MTTDKKTRGQAASARPHGYWRAWPSKGRYGSYALTVPQLSLRLGIHEWTIRREIRAGRLRAIKHRKWILPPGPRVYPVQRWLILWSDVEAWWALQYARGRELSDGRRRIRAARAKTQTSSEQTSQQRPKVLGGDRAKPGDSLTS